MKRLCFLAVAGLTLVVQTIAQAADSPSTTGDELELSTRVTALLTELDSSSFEVRQRAAAELERLVAQASREGQKTLAVALRQALISVTTSFEVRSQVIRWLPQLPEDRPQPTDAASSDLDELVRRLDDESYGTRLSAGSRLTWLLGRSELVIPVMLRLKDRLADASLPADHRALIEPIYNKSRAAWLMSDPATWNLPPVSDEQIARWISDLCLPAPANWREETWSVHQAAERELLDIMARDENVPRVRAALEAALRNPPLGAGPRLENVLQWTRPAMVAEIWQSGIHYTIQHLLVDVPQKPEHALKVTHFDRIDDRTAHCVSGNSLQEGDYPVGVAIPHPHPERSDQLTLFFHLTNLPTPRKRLWYEHYVEQDEAQRLAAITARTLARVIKDGRALGDGELRLLDYLDAEEISAKAGDYFAAIDDEPFAPMQNNIFNTKSRHAQYCAVLATRGTPAAVPGLLDAIRAGRITRAREESHNFPWIAVLAIAQRDEGHALHARLAELIEKTDRLMPSDESSEDYDLGATAAAILLLRHGRSPQDFGLAANSEPLLPDLKLLAYRFASPEHRDHVRRWWTSRSGDLPLP